MYHYETKTELRKALAGRKIRNIEFGDNKTPLSEQRSVVLHLDNGDSVVINVTTWQALEFEGA